MRFFARCMTARNRDMAHQQIRLPLDPVHREKIRSTRRIGTPVTHSSFLGILGFISFSPTYWTGFVENSGDITSSCVGWAELAKRTSSFPNAVQLDSSRENALLTPHWFDRSAWLFPPDAASFHSAQPALNATPREPWTQG
jgi:hypothetical protein